jgi:methyl-accepting chemotaxis protein
MKSMTMSKRLYGVALFIALVLLLSAAMTWRMGSIAVTALADEEKTTQGTVALSEAQNAVWALRWGVANYLATSDAAAKAKVVTDSPQLHNQFETSFQKYAQTNINEAEGAKLEELRGAFGKYADARLEFFQLMDAGKADDATLLRNTRLTPAGGATNKALGELLDLQREQAAEKTATDNGSLTTARTTLLIIFGVALAASILALTWVVRSMLRQLGGEPALVAEHVRSVAQGDLSRTIDTSAAAPASLLTALANMQTRLAGLVAEVRSASDSIATGSAEIAAGNADLSQRTEQQASNLKQTAASMEELSTTVNNNADIARQANQLAGSASSAAAKGGEVVGQVVATMDDITASSKKIADIIGVIDGIAFQTNILALNAAVEAARAGEQGRGFAVVASEVRNLAQRSAGAAKEIKLLIGASVEKVEAGSKLVGDAGANMADIVAQARRVADLIGEITSGTAEQATGIRHVGDAMTHLDRVTQQNAALVEESAAAAESLKTQAQNLVKVVGVFKLSAQTDAAEREPRTRRAAFKTQQAEMGLSAALST